MTHSWPPPLTAIHTPSTAEPSKFPFPTKVIPCTCSRHCVRSEKSGYCCDPDQSIVTCWVKITVNLASEVLHNAFKHFILQIMSVRTGYIFKGFCSLWRHSGLSSKCSHLRVMTEKWGNTGTENWGRLLIPSLEFRHIHMYTYIHACTQTSYTTHTL